MVYFERGLYEINNHKEVVYIDNYNGSLIFDFRQKPNDYKSKALSMIKPGSDLKIGINFIHNKPKNTLYDCENDCTILLREDKTISLKYPILEIDLKFSKVMTYEQSKPHHSHQY